MRIPSVLFDRPYPGVDQLAEPEFFGDLNLDQVLEAVTAGRAEYGLMPFFYAPLPDVSAVHYRHDVLRDLEDSEVREAIREHAVSMRTMREQLALAGKLRHRYQKQRWFLDAVRVYTEAVATLQPFLAGAALQSRGLQEFRDHLTGYVGSASFTSLVTDTCEVLAGLAQIRYSVHIRGSRVKVSRYDGEPDYSELVEQSFARFQQGGVKKYLVNFPALADMNHVEEQILDRVARLYPDAFGALDKYCARHRGYLDQTVGKFDREVQVYLAFLDFMRRFTPAGLPFCYPRVSTESKNTRVENAYDIALATKLVTDGASVVGNDLDLDGAERIVVVTGPNQGGKTTFARMVGQLHYLASLGLPVPAASARLFLPDRVFSHFEREEDLATLRGKLEDELVRIHDVLRRATSSSLIVMNESFTSTTLNDALFIGTQVLKQLTRRGTLAVYVTFVDELASLNDATVSMTATVDPDNPAERTYKVVRRPADGLAYAAAIADKYGLTYASLRRRIAS